MLKRARRILLASAIGLVVLAAAIWVLTRALDQGLPRYQGHPIYYWIERSNSPDPAMSNQACYVLNAVVIPQLTNTLFHDLSDSQLRLELIERLNTLPGVQINYLTAPGRRAGAAEDLGLIGPPAKRAIPELVMAVRGKDLAVRPPAALALGEIQSEPDTIIPLLTGLLDDPQEGVPESAAAALGHFGSLSKAAVPKLLELLKIRDKELNVAVSRALKQIDPEAAAKAGVR